MICSKRKVFDWVRGLCPGWVAPRSIDRSRGPARAPGSDWFHYTNLNFPVVASVIERVTGERFDVARTAHAVRVGVRIAVPHEVGAMLRSLGDPPMNNGG